MMITAKPNGTPKMPAEIGEIANHNSTGLATPNLGDEAVVVAEVWPSMHPVVDVDQGAGNDQHGLHERHSCRVSR